MASDRHQASAEGRRLVDSLLPGQIRGTAPQSWGSRGPSGDRGSSSEPAPSPGCGAGPALRCPRLGAPCSEGSASGRTGHWPGSKQASELHQGVDQGGSHMSREPPVSCGHPGGRPHVHAVCSEAGHHIDIGMLEGGHGATELQCWLPGFHMQKNTFVLFKPLSQATARDTRPQSSLRASPLLCGRRAGAVSAAESPLICFMFNHVF